MARAIVFFNPEVGLCSSSFSFAQGSLDWTLGGLGSWLVLTWSCQPHLGCRTHADLTHWEVVGAGFEGPFVFPLPCMACLRPGWGRGAEAKEAAVRPFSFGKRTFLLAVILGKEHGRGLSDFLMSFILSTSMVSVGPNFPRRPAVGGPMS